MEMMKKAERTKIYYKLYQEGRSNEDWFPMGTRSTLKKAVGLAEELAKHLKDGTWIAISRKRPVNYGKNIYERTLKTHYYYVQNGQLIEY